MKWALVLVVAGCWRSSAPQPPSVAEPVAEPPPAQYRPPRPDATVEPAVVDDLGTPPSEPACRSGFGIASRIVAVAVQGSRTVVTITGGADQGVTRSWIVVQPALACVIVRVDAHATSAECAATRDQIIASRNALLCAP